MGLMKHLSCSAGLADLSGVLGAQLWRLPSVLQSIPAAAAVEQQLSSQESGAELVAEIPLGHAALEFAVNHKLSFRVAHQR